MGTVNELHITNWVDTGQTTPFSRYQFTLTLKWVDAQGVTRTHGPQQYTFPNDLATMPVAVRREFAQKMIEATVRVTLGIDEWSDYA